MYQSDMSVADPGRDWLYTYMYMQEDQHWTNHIFMITILLCPQKMTHHDTGLPFPPFPWVCRAQGSKAFHSKCFQHVDFIECMFTDGSTHACSQTSSAETHACSQTSSAETHACSQPKCMCQLAAAFTNVEEQHLSDFYEV